MQKPVRRLAHTQPAPQRGEPKLGRITRRARRQWGDAVEHTGA